MTKEAEDMQFMVQPPVVEGDSKQAEQLFQEEA